MKEKEFKDIVDNFDQARDKTGARLNIHYLLIKEGDETQVHRFKDRREKSDIRSISKTVMTLVLGIVMKKSQEGVYPQIDENTYVYPYLEGLVELKRKENLPYLKKLQVKHLLTHSIGYDQVIMMRDDIKDLEGLDFLSFVLNYPVKHEPGDHYLYSNAGFYLLSVFLEEFLQEDLEVFIKRELFDKLDIKDYSWERYGPYLAGATRLWLYPEDLLKIGILMKDGGVYEKERLINKDFIEKMTQIYYRTEGVDTKGAIFRRYGYGYGTWLAKEDFFFGHGTDGQMLVVLPDHDFIMVVQSYQHDIAPIEAIINDVIKDKFI